MVKHTQTVGGTWSKDHVPFFDIWEGGSFMKDKRLIELLNRHIDIYINNIAFELERTHSQWFEGFGFPLFGETSKQYHEQVAFQSYLESYTRQMINGMLKEILDQEVADKITWPELSSVNIYNGYTNSEIEKEFGFEFINQNSKTGFRYSYFYADEIEGLLTKGNVDNIVLVIWENKNEIIGFEYDDKRVSVILLWNLFHELFDDMDEEEISRMYDIFTEKVTKTVEKATSMISLTTLPGFTPSYLYRTRNDLITDLRKEVRLLSRFIVDSEDFKQNELDSKQLIVKYKLPQYFLNKRFENAFVGISDFAKSYMTSEYLYCHFKDNPMFDYTPIVSGYLKSIEQLLHVLCTSYDIKRNKQRDISKDTLGQYINIIKGKKFYRKELESAKDIIVNCLNSYNKESRNNLFHKDYFNTWERVEQIRANTIFLYVALLGAIDSSIINSNPAVLGIINIEYDQLFCAIDKQKSNWFSFILKGKEYLKMRKEIRSKGLVFNEYGLITNTVLFQNEYDYFEPVEISRSNMPSKVWITDALGKHKSMIWPIE